jgi:hypothetical protein|nr:MAG TPA: Head decoration protein [Caudoviricetes sp.]
MFNRPGIKKETLAAPQQILFNVQNQMSVPILVDKTMASVTVDGRKVVKAGTPLSGDLTARGTAFKAAVDTSAPAVGVLLHDVDITDNNANGTLLIWGFVNLDRLDSATAALITATRKTELAGRVWFLKDN